MKTITEAYICDHSDFGVKPYTLYIEVPKSEPLNKCLAIGNYVCRTNTFIRNAFNYGFGTMKDFNDYAKSNKGNFTIYKLV